MLSESFRNEWLQRRNPVFVSFSGGSDSLALLLLLHDFARKQNLSVTAVHFEHGLRGNASLEDAEFCRKTAEELHLAFLCRSLDVPRNRKHGESDESAARRLRLEAWQQWTAEGVLPGNAWIALAHHGDDAQETLFLRLIRGSNVSGLTALREKRCFMGLCFVRPLLKYSKKDLILYLRERGIFSWCHDATNEESCYARNYFRLQIIQDIRKRFAFAQQGLNRSLEALNMDADFLEQCAEKEYQMLRHHHTLSLSGFQKLHPALQHRVIRKYLSFRLQQDYLPDGELLKRIRNTLTVFPQKMGQEIKLPLAGLNNVFLSFYRNQIDLKEEAEDLILNPPQHYIWDWQKEPVIQTRWGKFTAHILYSEQLQSPITGSDRIFLDADKVSRCFLISPKNAGDAMVPFGKSHAKKCKKIFSDAHISTSQQPSVPFLRTESGSIIWMTGIRRSNIAIKDHKTQKILQIDFSGLPQNISG